jgi:hypothetical protein
MDQAELRSALTADLGELRIDSHTLTPNIADFLRTYFGGAPIVITEATVDTSDQDAVVVHGRTTLFAAPDIPVRLRAFADAAGWVHLTLVYTMPESWRFSHSFPTLPKVLDWSRTVEDPTVSPLDALPFSDVTFFAHSDRSFEFSATLRATGPAVLENLLAGTEPMLVGGVVVPEESTPTVPELAAGWYPWSAGRLDPGIYVQTTDASMLATPGVGRLGLDQLRFRLYSPLTEGWLATNPTYRPVFGYDMRLTIGSAGRSVDVFADMQLGASELLLFGSFSGFTLGSGLTALNDLIGSEDLLATLHPDLRTPEALKNLELTDAAVSLVRSTTASYVGWVSVTVAVRELNWRVWENHFEVRSVACQFELDDPFGRASRTEDGGLLSRLSVTLSGSMEVEGVPATVIASNADGFQVHGELAERRVIPLQRLMETYLPGVPPPSDLTIDLLRVSVAPGRSYGMAMGLAAEPNPWRIPLGPVELTVSEVFFAFTRTHDGPVSGSFRGAIALGGASVAVSYAMTGELGLRGRIERIGLTELARELAAVTDLTLPPGFPELTLNDSEVVFTAAGQGRYDVRVSTTVAIGDVANLNLAAALLRTPQETGFAVGIWTGDWPGGKGWSPGDLWEPLRALTIEKAGLFLCSLTPTAEQLTAFVPAEDVPAALQRDFALRSGVNFFARLRLDKDQFAILRELFGGDARFDLFAAFGGDGSTLVARLDIERSTGDFVFRRFELAWVSTVSVEVDITARAAGTLTIGDETLNYSLGGRLSSKGAAGLTLTIDDWAHPFGYERLTVEQFVATITLTAEGGLNLALGGTFRFAVDKPFTFGVAAAIVDFEVPSALAFVLRGDSPGKTLRLSEVIEGITTIDVSNLPAIYLLDLFLTIEELCFWVVLVDEVTIDRQKYTKGFGFRGKITLFGRPVVLAVEVNEAQHRFAGQAELPEPVSIGTVLTMRRHGEPDKGPVLRLSSHVDNQHPEHLLVSAEVTLLDVARVDCYARATAAGLVYSFDLKAGTSGAGAWVNQRVDVLISREQLTFAVGFASDFGFKNVALGGFTLFGLLWVPEITLPSFTVKAVLNLNGSVTPARFHLDAAVDFTYLGSALSERITIDLDLAAAPATLGAVGSALLEKIRTRLAGMLASALDTAGELVAWVAANLSVLGAGAIGSLTRILRDVFGLGSSVALSILSVAGLPGDPLAVAMTEVYKWSNAVLAAAVEAFADFTTHVADFFGSRHVTMVVFNLTTHRLKVIGARGDEIRENKDLEIGPGGAGEVAVYRATTGTWEWVYLRDLDTGKEYQLYIQMSGVVGNKYFSFDHRNPNNREGNTGSARLPDDVARSTWNGGPVASYTLLRVP